RGQRQLGGRTVGVGNRPGAEAGGTPGKPSRGSGGAGLEGRTCRWSVARNPRPRYCSPHAWEASSAMASKIRGADILARTLDGAGLRTIFSLSGNHIMALFDAALGPGLQLVHVRHEAAAVHMADAWARLTGQCGIALVTGGPGHANAVGALLTALASESPLVLLSGHAATHELGRGAFHEPRQADMALPPTTT